MPKALRVLRVQAQPGRDHGSGPCRDRVLMIPQFLPFLESTRYRCGSHLGLGPHDGHAVLGVSLRAVRSSRELVGRYGRVSAVSTRKLGGEAVEDA